MAPSSNHNFPCVNRMLTDNEIILSHIAKTNSIGIPPNAAALNSSLLGGMTAPCSKVSADGNSECGGPITGLSAPLSPPRSTGPPLGGVAMPAGVAVSTISGIRMSDQWRLGLRKIEGEAKPVVPLIVNTDGAPLPNLTALTNQNLEKMILDNMIGGSS